MARIIKGKVVLTTERHKTHSMGEIITIYADGNTVARLRQIGKTHSDVRLEWLDKDLQEHAVQFPLCSLADVDAGAVERMWERHLKPGATGFHHPLRSNPRKGKIGHPIADGMASAALEKELFAIEPKIDFLHDVLGIGRFAEVYRTSDGFYMGRDFGDIGANAFLGKPSPQALRRSAGYFQKLSPSAQHETLTILADHNIPPAEMGIDARWISAKPVGLSRPELNNPVPTPERYKMGLRVLARMKNRPVRSVAELNNLFDIAESYGITRLGFAVRLNYGLRSSKMISRLQKKPRAGWVYDIFNNIDDTWIVLSEKGLMDSRKTLIGEAMKVGAFTFDGDEGG